jgi:hypothetical protein
MNRNLVSGILILCAGSIVAILSIWFYPKNPEFGMVDTSIIVTEQAKILAKKNPGAAFTAERMRQITDDLKGQMSAWCLNHNVILLSKGAVWGGELVDYTQEILMDFGFKEEIQ